LRQADAIFYQQGREIKEWLKRTKQKVAFLGRSRQAYFEAFTTTLQFQKILSIPMERGASGPGGQRFCLTTNKILGKIIIEMR
jgi:hypothetical protein